MPRSALFLSTALLFQSSAPGVSVGDWVVVVRPVELELQQGKATVLTPGTSAKVLAVEGQRLFVSLGKIGRVPRADIMPLDDALARFSETIAKNPSDATAWFARGKILFHRGEHDKAIADLDEAMRLSPGNSEAHAIRGFAYKGRGDKDRALADLNRALELDPTNSLAWRVRGATWASKADYAKALADYNESIRLDPDNPDSLNHRVVMLSACRDATIRNGKQAVADATRACQLTEWRIPLYIANLGIAYAEMGDFDAAIKWNTRAMELSPPDRAKALEARLEEYRNKQPFRMTWR